MDNDTITTAEAAARLGVSPARILDLIEEHRFPGAYRTGKGYRIPLASFEQFRYLPAGRPRKRMGRPRVSRA
jgi:excisionase family DNA binding protein